MNMFPDYVLNLNTVIDSTVTAMSSTPREYAWDFENNDFRLVDGKFQIVEGKEALKIWIWKALKTMRMTYSIYSDDYGHDLDSLIGQGFSNALIETEAKRLVLKCLSINPHITGIENFMSSGDGDTLAVSFTAITDQGEVKYSEL